MPANEHDSGETSAATGAGGNKSAEHPLRDKMKKKLKGVLDVGYWDTNTVDQDTSYAPAVTAETVKPVVHEEIREEIHRDIHTHDEYHRIQPIKEVEVLPARHWVPGPDGRLMAVAEKDVPSYMAKDQERVLAGLAQQSAKGLPDPPRPKEKD